jgi:hypothetical protein
MKDETNTEFPDLENSATASEGARLDATSSVVRLDATSSAARLDALSAPIQARAERAYARIRGDEGLTGSLTDDVARRLLDWAREEVVRLAAATEAMEAGEADAWLAARVGELRHHLRQIARSSAAAPSPEEAVRAQLLEAEPESDEEEKPGRLARSTDEGGTTR